MTDTPRSHKLLSPAEHEQRRNAARARWAAAGIGAAIGGYITDKLVDRRERPEYVEARRNAVHGIRRAKYAIADEEALHNRISSSIDRHHTNRLGSIRGWPVPAYRGLLGHRIYLAHSRLRGMAGELVHEDEAGQIIVPHDQQTASLHRGSIESDKAALDRLEAAKKPKRVTRTQAQVKATRAHLRRVPDRIENHNQAKAEFDAKEAQRAIEHEAAHEEAYAEHIRSGGHPDDVPPYKPYRKRSFGKTQTKLVPVKEGKATTRSSHKARQAKEFPDSAERSRMRRELSDLSRQKQLTSLMRESKRHQTFMSAREAALAASKEKFLNVAELRSSVFKPVRQWGKIGAGIALGATIGIAGAGLAQHFITPSRGQTKEYFVKLAKAFNEQSHPRDDSGKFKAAGLKAEREVAIRLGRTFRAWKDEVATKITTPQAKTLREHIHTDLTHALRPLESASRAGATAPIRVERNLDFTFKGRSPFVEAFLDKFRASKITELTNEQMDTIKGVLIDAAKRGASPDAMARDIRQTIGLTANQAQAIYAYRRELEMGDKRALKRALRDKRYDKAIGQAISAGKPLAPSQVSKIVDAYHRKYLAYRAMTIARTEGVGAANNGHMAAVQEALDQNPDMDVIKTWMSHLDEKTRPDHVGLHGQEVTGFDSPFKADSGDLIRWPHDPSAPARNVINCRCTVSTRLVPKGKYASTKAGGEE